MARQVAITGEPRLSDELWAVEDLTTIKVEGADREGLKKALLPPLHWPQTALDNPLAGAEVVHVPRIFEAINHMVKGERGSRQAGTEGG